MNVSQINDALLSGNRDFTHVLPRYGEYVQAALPLPFEFGLRELPREPGIISVRGPRQYGKSTWLEQEIVHTVENFGKGSALYLNGDEIVNDTEFYQAIETLLKSFSKNAKVRRLFIDEITSIPDWERIL